MWGMNKGMGRRLCGARVEAGYKAKDFAALLGRTPRMLQRYESGATPPPLEVLHKWSELTGRPLEYLLEDPKPRPQEAPPAVTHPGIEALAADAQTLTRYGITPDELDLLRGGIYPVTITEKRDALDLLLVNLRAGPRSVESTYQKSHHKPRSRVRPPR